MSEYIYDPALEDEHTRLHALEDVLDPGSIRVFEAIGVDKTWRCLEVGGGGGSIAQWLSDHAGRVVATDLDTRYLERITATNLEIRKHNVVTEPLEPDSYDLVHSRDVLEHIPEREAVLDKMVAALKPGGWLVAEDVDFTNALRADGFGEPSEVLTLETAWYRAGTEEMRRRGIDPEFGRLLPWRLRARGLTDVSADVRTWLIRGGTPAAMLHQLSLDQLHPLLNKGGMSDEDVARMAAFIGRDDFMAFGPIHIAAWGRKPA